MPYKAHRLCLEPNCNKFAINGSSRCQEHKKLIEKKINQSRDITGIRYRATNYWKHARVAFLRRRPMCAECGGMATEVDHIIPWSTWEDFADVNNWQALCKSCHSRKTAEELRERKVW